MREIKFKYYYRNSEGHTISKVFDMDSDIANGAHFDYVCDCPLMKDYKILDRVQYTGLKDDNGVEIYEGDILRAGEDNFIIKAQWSDKGFWQCQYYYKGEKNKTDGLVYAIKSRAKALDCKCLVIGNIYENHDLLESNNE